MPEQKKRAAPTANRIAALSKDHSQIKYIATYVVVVAGAPALAFIIALALAGVAR